MKFNTYDELIKYLKDKDLATLEFDIIDADPISSNTISTEPSSILPPQPTATLIVATEAMVKFTSFFESPEFSFDVGDESIMLVDAYTSIPNSCSTTRVNIGDRELLIGVCEDSSGQATAKFDIVANGKPYFCKKFRIETDTAKYKNTISLND